MKVLTNIMNDHIDYAYTTDTPPYAPDPAVVEAILRVLADRPNGDLEATMLSRHWKLREVGVGEMRRVLNRMIGEQAVTDWPIERWHKDGVSFDMGWKHRGVFEHMDEMPDWIKVPFYASLAKDEMDLRAIEEM